MVKFVNIRESMSFKSQKIIYFSITIILGLLLLQNANAQTLPSFIVTYEPLPIFAGDTAVVSIIPNNFSPASTTFQWYINGALNSSISGLGKSSISVKTTPGKAEIISVKVAVDPGPGFEKIERQVPFATLPPFQNEQEMLQEASKAKSSFSILAIPSNPSPGQTTKNPFLFL